MNPERAAMQSLDHRPPDEHPVIVEAYQKADKLLAEDAIDIEDFVDHYGKEQVQHDREKVERFRSSFEQNQTRHTAKVFEALLYTHGEQSNWLGENVETIKTSEYDDIVNGVDVIAEFNKDDQPATHLALAIDITFSSKSMDSKFERIQKEIDADELANIKYFEAHGFKGRLRQRPRIVIGAQHDTVKELAALWTNAKNAELGKHHIRHLLRKEIKEQLKTFLQYAESHEKNNAAKSYRQALNLIKTLKFDAPTEEDTERIESDRVFQEIQFQLESFRK